jgi:diguanylate cyclase (GGDEF)-like protein
MADFDAEKESPHSVRVLLIARDEGAAEALRATLRAARCTVFEVLWIPRLVQALDHPDAKAAQLVLLDLASGPGIDQLTQVRLRLPNLPVIAIGDSQDEAFAMRALASGARAYLHRGEVNPRLLATTLANALDNHRTIRELGSTRERARYLASHDQLTGLANRTLFHEELDRALEVARRSRQKAAVLYIDLDGFKAINDTLGHAVGDGLLRGIARQITRCLREGDVAARLGGDEFAVLLPALDDERDAIVFAEKLLAALERPIPLRSRALLTTASIGVALFPKDGLEAEDLLRKADTAMYTTKESGRNGYACYSQAMNASVLRRAALESGLREAGERGEFVLCYQPQFDVRRERIVGAEALLRWQHPQLGALAPAEFMPVAEESGAIFSVGEWVLREACRQAARWRVEDHRELLVSVNVSPQQFRDAALAELVRDTLSDTGLPADRLELEITEGCLLEDIDVTLRTLIQLKQLGVRISIDDFGTGYSALSYLKRLPIDALKIDQSFVRALATDPADVAITKTIVRLAQGLRKSTVAEGVETIEQLLMLASFGCHRLQGFLFGRPAPFETFREWLVNPPFRWIKGEAESAGSGPPGR